MFVSNITHVNAISRNASIQFPFCSLLKHVEMRTLTVWPRHSRKYHTQIFMWDAMRINRHRHLRLQHPAKLCVIIHFLRRLVLNLLTAFFLVSFVFTFFFYFIKIKQFAAVPEFVCLQTHSTFSIYFEEKIHLCNKIVGEMLGIRSNNRKRTNTLRFHTKPIFPWQKKKISF